MYEKFTDRARKVMAFANQEAQRFNHEHVDTEHLLLGLIKEGSGVAANVLKNMGADLKKVRLEVEKLITPGPDIKTIGTLPKTLAAKKAIEKALEAARDLKHDYVGTEHLLLGLCSGDKEWIATKVLANLGVLTAKVREEVIVLLGGSRRRGS